MDAVAVVVVVCRRRSGNAATRRLRRQRQQGLQLQQLRVHLKYSARHLAALLARKKNCAERNTKPTTLPLWPAPPPPLGSFSESEKRFKLQTPNKPPLRARQLLLKTQRLCGFPAPSPAACRCHCPCPSSCYRRPPPSANPQPRCRQ